MTAMPADFAALFAGLARETAGMASCAKRVECEIANLLRQGPAPDVPAGADLQQIDLLCQHLAALSALFQTLQQQMAGPSPQPDIPAALLAVPLPSLAGALQGLHPPPQTGHLDLF